VISASKKTISANDPGGQTAAVSIIAAKPFFSPSSKTHFF
jgi:hypothetical protein